MKFGVYFAYWEHEWDADFSKYCKKVADLAIVCRAYAAATLMPIMSPIILTLAKIPPP